MDYTLVFDPVMVRQLRKLESNKAVKYLVLKLLEHLRTSGPQAGELLDSRLFLYELKCKRPPLRIYFKPQKTSDEIYVFFFEMKTNPKKQKRTINELRRRLKTNVFSHELFSFLDVLFKLQQTSIEARIPKRLNFTFHLLVFLFGDFDCFHKQSHMALLNKLFANNPGKFSTQSRVYRTANS